MSVERGRVAEREKEGVRERGEGEREGRERERGRDQLTKTGFPLSNIFYHQIISFSRLLQFQFSFWNRKIERPDVVHFVNKQRSRL